MSQVHQVAPCPYQVEPIELPDDGALVIDTTGSEVLDAWPCSANTSASSNDNAANELDCVRNEDDVVPFVTTLPRVG
jgi:hypothetical protein